MLFGLPYHCMSHNFCSFGPCLITLLAPFIKHIRCASVRQSAACVPNKSWWYNFDHIFQHFSDSEFARYIYNQTWEWCQYIACVFDVIMISINYQNMSQGLSIATFVFVMVVIAPIISLIPGINKRGLKRRNTLHCLDQYAAQNS